VRRSGAGSRDNGIEAQISIHRRTYIARFRRGIRPLAPYQAPLHQVRSCPRYHRSGMLWQVIL